MANAGGEAAWAVVVARGSHSRNCLEGTETWLAAYQSSRPGTPYSRTETCPRNVW